MSGRESRRAQLAELLMKGMEARLSRMMTGGAIDWDKRA
jgi:hypothetical protein